MKGRARGFVGRSGVSSRSDSDSDKLEAKVRKLAGRWLAMSSRLADRERIACADFTVADIMMACVLRGFARPI